MTVGLIAIDPKTHKPRHLQGIQPNGGERALWKCGCVTIEGETGGSHYIIVTLRAASSARLDFQEVGVSTCLMPGSNGGSLDRNGVLTGQLNMGNLRRKEILSME